MSTNGTDVWCINSAIRIIERAGLFTAQETTATLTNDISTWVASTPAVGVALTLPLPTDFRNFRNLRQVKPASKVINKVSLEKAEIWYPEPVTVSSTTDVFKACVVSEDNIYLYPFITLTYTPPATAYSFILSYEKYNAELINDTDYNFITTRFPELVIATAMAFEKAWEHEFELAETNLMLANSLATGLAKNEAIHDISGKFISLGELKSLIARKEEQSVN